MGLPCSIQHSWGCWALTHCSSLRPVKRSLRDSQSCALSLGGKYWKFLFPFLLNPNSFCLFVCSSGMLESPLWKDGFTNSLCLWVFTQVSTLQVFPTCWVVGAGLLALLVLQPKVCLPITRCTCV